VIFNRRLKEQLAERERRIAELEEQIGATVRPENIVWVLGSPRTGSTWLAQMMAAVEGNALWREPQFGLVLRLRELVVNPQRRLSNQNFLLGDPYKEVWLRSMRNLFLDGAGARFPDLEGLLVVKDPNASMGAPLVMEAFPESRLVFVVRDARDVVASQLDASREGSWHGGMGYQASLFDTGEGDVVEQLARQYVINLEATKRAYEAHRGPKSRVLYEELRPDALSGVGRIFDEIGAEVEASELEKAVRRQDWESIPEEKKGEGRSRRKATPGGWREDLSPEQAATVERITAPLMEEFYPER
jgi:LPS sulfotransferase NodH